MQRVIHLPFTYHLQKVTNNFWIVKERKIQFRGENPQKIGLLKKTGLGIWITRFFEEFQFFQ